MTDPRDDRQPLPEIDMTLVGGASRAVGAEDHRDDELPIGQPAAQPIKADPEAEADPVGASTSTVNDGGPSS